MKKENKEKKVKVKKEKFDLMKELKEKVEKEHLQFEGAIIAFRRNKFTGTATICEDLGVRLRLLQECKIQEKIIELQSEDMAKTALTPIIQPNKIDDTRSYLGYNEIKRIFMVGI